MDTGKRPEENRQKELSQESDNEQRGGKVVSREERDEILNNDDGSENSGSSLDAQESCVQERQPSQLETNLPFLKYLLFTNEEERTALLANLSKRQLRCLCENAHNVLVGNVPLDRSTHSKLHNFRDDIRLLARKQVSFKIKRKILRKRGLGLISMILPSLTTILGSLLVNLLH